MAKKIDAKKMEEELVHLDTQLKRALADYRNLEKRVQDDVTHYAHRSRAELVAKLLPVLDSLDQVVDRGRSILSEQSESKDWFRGVELAVKQFRQVLSEEGLVEVDTSGQFDPNLHEAIDLKEGEHDKILEVILRGYSLGGKIVRPARVVVGRSNVIASEAKQSGSEEIAASPSAPRNDIELDKKGE